MQLQELPSNYLLLFFVDLALMAVKDNCVHARQCCFQVWFDLDVHGLVQTFPLKDACVISQPVAAMKCRRAQLSGGHDYTKINVYYVS